MRERHSKWNNSAALASAISFDRQYKEASLCVLLCFLLLLAPAPVAPAETVLRCFPSFCSNVYYSTTKLFPTTTSLEYGNCLCAWTKRGSKTPGPCELLKRQALPPMAARLAMNNARPRNRASFFFTTYDSHMVIRLLFPDGFLSSDEQVQCQ